MIAAVTVLSRVLGFGRYLVQAHAFGDGSIGGVYNAANTLPNVLFEVAAGGALAGALIPVLALPVSRALRKDVDAITSATFGWTLLVLVPLGAALAAASGLIASVWPKLDDAEQRPPAVLHRGLRRPGADVRHRGPALRGAAGAQAVLLAGVRAGAVVRGRDRDLPGLRGARRR